MQRRLKSSLVRRNAVGEGSLNVKDDDRALQVTEVPRFVLCRQTAFCPRRRLLYWGIPQQAVPAGQFDHAFPGVLRLLRPSKIWGVPWLVNPTGRAGKTKGTADDWGAAACWLCSPPQALDGL